MEKVLSEEIEPGVVRGRWWHRLDDGRIQCDLCPRFCRLHEGQKAFCFVREARGGEIVLTSYGRATGYCIDPIEKKPLNHFYPGSSVLSFGTAGWPGRLRDYGLAARRRGPLQCMPRTPRRAFRARAGPLGIEAKAGVSIRRGETRVGTVVARRCSPCGVSRGSRRARRGLFPRLDDDLRLRLDRRHD